MADGLYCIRCGYNETHHQNKHFISGYVDGTLPKEDHPCDDFTPDPKEQADIDEIHQEERKTKQEYMEFHEKSFFSPVIITNRKK